LLRASNTATGIENVALAAELEAFAIALAQRSDDLPAHRSVLQSAGGGVLFIEAAAVAAIFHGYVRVAEGTGIPLDELVVATSVGLRDEMGIDAYAGRENSHLEVDERPAEAFNPGLRL